MIILTVECINDYTKNDSSNKKTIRTVLLNNIKVNDGGSKSDDNDDN